MQVIGDPYILKMHVFGTCECVVIEVEYAYSSHVGAYPQFPVSAFAYIIDLIR